MTKILSLLLGLLTFLLLLPGTARWDLLLLFVFLPLILLHQLRNLIWTAVPLVQEMSLLEAVAAGAAHWDNAQDCHFFDFVADGEVIHTSIERMWFSWVEDNYSILWAVVTDDDWATAIIGFTAILIWRLLVILEYWRYRIFHFFVFSNVLKFSNFYKVFRNFIIIIIRSWYSLLKQLLSGMFFIRRIVLSHVHWLTILAFKLIIIYVTGTNWGVAIIFFNLLKMFTWI